MAETVILIANGDLRLAANQTCWAAQAEVEKQVMDAVRGFGRDIERGHAYDETKKHGFIDSQKRGMEVFRTIPPTAPLIVAEAVWQYSHHTFTASTRTRAPSSPSPIGAASGPAWWA